MGVTLQEARQALDNFEAVTSHEGTSCTDEMNQGLSRSPGTGSFD